MTRIFASRSVTEHVLRGIIGLCLSYAALRCLAQPGLPNLASAVILEGFAIFAFRGCPMCWTVGMIHTVFGKFTGAKACEACNNIANRKVKS